MDLSKNRFVVISYHHWNGWLKPILAFCGPNWVFWFLGTILGLFWPKGPHFEKFLIHKGTCQKLLIGFFPLRGYQFWLQSSESSLMIIIDDKKKGFGRVHVFGVFFTWSDPLFLVAFFVPPLMHFFGPCLNFTLPCHLLYHSFFEADDDDGGALTCIETPTQHFREAFKNYLADFVR